MIKEKNNSEDGYLISLDDLNEIIKIWDSMTKTDSPYYAWFKCLDRGLIKIDLKEFNPCNNQKCGICVNFNEAIKKLVNDKI